MKNSVTFKFPPITVPAEGKNEKELLEHAKAALIEQLQKEFPFFEYSFHDIDALTYDNVTEGLIVEWQKGAKGIVTRVNKNNIYVVLTGHRIIKAEPQAFKRSNATFEEARSKRFEFEQDVWREGDSGYLQVEDGIVEVVVGKEVRGKYKVHEINENRRTYSLIFEQMQKFLKDEKPE